MLMPYCSKWLFEFEFLKGHVNTCYIIRWGGQICNLLLWNRIFSIFHMPTVIVIAVNRFILTELFAKILVAFLEYGVYAVKGRGRSITVRFQTAHWSTRRYRRKMTVHMTVVRCTLMKTETRRPSVLSGSIYTAISDPRSSPRWFPLRSLSMPV